MPRPPIFKPYPINHNDATPEQIGAAIIKQCEAIANNRGTVVGITSGPGFTIVIGAHRSPSPYGSYDDVV